MKKTVLFIFSLIALSGYAQNNNSGTEFWAGFLRADTDSIPRPFKLFISSGGDANVTIAVPKQSFSVNIVVPKDSVIIYELPSYLIWLDFFSYEVILKGGVHITSDIPVSVSAVSQGTGQQVTTDASVVFPLANIPAGPSYVSGNDPTFFTGGHGPNEIMLVGCEDSTIVEITPSAKTDGTTSKKRPAWKPFQVILNRGETYQICSFNSLNGSLINVLNAKKMVVFTGSMVADWPCTIQNSCSNGHQYEQVLPSSVLDTSYCLPMQFGHDKGYVTILNPIDTVGISIKVNGIIYNNVSRKKPLILDLAEAAYVSSTTPFYCYQFAKGTDWKPGPISFDAGDPNLVSIVSNKSMAKSALFSTVHSTNLRNHFVSIVIKTSAKGKVYMDKTKIDSTEFIPFEYAKSYSYCMLKIDKGQHLLECSEGLLAYAFGVGFWESYFYLAGFGLPNFNPDFKDSVVTYDCQHKKIKMLFRSNSVMPLKSYTWDFGDGQTGTGNPIQHTYDKPGLYEVKLVSLAYDKKKDSAIRKVKVGWPDFDPVRDKIICGKDSVTFEEKNPFFTNFKWQDSSAKNHLIIGSSTKVWVKATDASGHCIFVDTGKVKKIDIVAKLFIDSIETCYLSNKFNFRDSVEIIEDSLLAKRWVLPWNTYWDTTNIGYHFLKPGNYKVYLDVYTKQANCKARYPVDVSVHPMPVAASSLKQQDYCSNKPFLITDKSIISSGSIKKVKWLFDDKTTITSDSLKTYKTLFYDKNKQDILRFVDHIAISDFNCADTVRTAVLIWPKPEVNFSLTTPDTIKCLSAARWTFTSLTKVDDDTFSLYWNSGNGKVSTDNAIKNVRYYNTGKYKVTLKALSPFGCNDSISKTIEVIPELKAGFSVNDSAQCLRNNQFSFYDTSNSLTKLYYLWTLGNGKTSNNAMVDSVHYNSAGLKLVKLLINSPYEGCIDSVKHEVMVMKDPLAKISTNKDTQCLNGHLFNFYNKSIFYQPYLSSEWTSGILFDTNFNYLSFTGKDTGNYTFRLVVKDQEGCTDTAIKLIRITPQPLLTLSINDSVQCFRNNSFIFNASNKSSATHRWKIDNEPSVSNSKDSLLYQENIPGLHQVTMISSNKEGCIDSLSKAFRVLDSFKVDFSINSDSQCLNTNRFSFTDATIAGNNKINAWTYYANNLSYTSNPNSPDVIYTSDGKKTVRYIIKTTEGCTDSMQHDVFIIPDIAGHIKGDSVCLNELATIKFEQTKGSPATTWNWDLGDGNKANTSPLAYTYSKSGTYTATLQVSDMNGCKTTLTLKDAVRVYPLPDPSFTYLQKPFAINIDKVIFQSNLKKATHYLWRLPDGSIKYSDTAEFVINKLYTGTVSLIVTNEFGCKDSSSLEIYIYPEKFNAFIPNAISVNDDGLNDIFKVEGLENADNFKLKIFNRWGEQLFYSTDITSGWDAKYKGEYVQAGVYTYSITFTYQDHKSYEIVGVINILR